MGIRAAQWTNYRWNAEYSKRTSALHVFIPRASSRLFGMGLPKTSWVKLNRLRTGVGRFQSSLYKWGLAPSPNCKCGAIDQTADDVFSTCLIHRAPRWVDCVRVLDGENRCWLNTIIANIRSYRIFWMPSIRRRRKHIVCVVVTLDGICH